MQPRGKVGGGKGCATRLSPFRALELLRPIRPEAVRGLGRLSPTRPEAKRDLGRHSPTRLGVVRGLGKFQPPVGEPNAIVYGMFLY